MVQNHGSLEAESQTKRKVSQALLIGAIFKHIVEVVFGVQAHDTITHAYKHTFAQFGKMIIVIEFLLAIFIADLFYATIKQYPNLRTGNQPEAIPTVVLMAAIVK